LSKHPNNSGYSHSMTWTRFVAALGGLLLSGCATQPPEVWKASTIAQAASPTVRLIGKENEVLGQIDRDAAGKLLEIKGRIENAAGVRYAELLITTGDSPNAFSGPTKQGLVVGVNLSMIKLFESDWDAFAAIMGHEYAHIVLNHSGIRQQREETRQGFSSVLGFALGLAGVPMSGTVADLTTTAVATTYTRDEERDADKAGLGYAKRAGYDPRGAVRAWQKMMSASGSFSIPFLSTHPTSAERLETMKQLAEQ
jgi:beta-barrel assembly-enhancing protease